MQNLILLFKWGLPLYEEGSSFYDVQVFESFLESFSFFILFLTVVVYWFVTAFHFKAKSKQFASLMVKMSNLSLTLLLGVRWITSHHFPLSNLYESLVFLSWSLTVIHFVLERQSNTLLVGILFSPITLFVNGFALFTLPSEMQKGHLLTPALQSNWLMMHVTVMISSYAALLSGSVLGIAFLVITRGTDKEPSSLHQANRSPSLQNIEPTSILQIDTSFAKSTSMPGYIDHQCTHLSCKENAIFLRSEDKTSSSLKGNTNLAKVLDNLSYRAVGIGFPLLTIGILSGAVWANEAWGSYWSWDPKETWALITWFLFAIYLHTRITKGLDGREPAIIAAVGFVVVWICFIGVNLASQGLHTYGWLQ